MPQRSRYVLPVTIDPPDSICYEVPVPNDPFHIAAFKGAIFGLAKAYEWQNDPDHLAKEVAAVWLKIFNGLKECTPCPENPGFAGADGGGEELIRQNPDNPCEIQSSADGTHWCTFIDISLCVPGVSQPGDGSEQPTPGGGTACYHANMQGNSKWLLPTVVSTGDIIDVTGATGATNDGSNVFWWCPDGELFFAGACAGGGTNDGADPLPAELHMSLIGDIGGTFYPILAGSPFTVPGGVLNEQVIFQVNDSTLSDNSGSLAFDVCVTNNQAGDWAHSWNFLVTQGPFVPIVPADTFPRAVYTPGVGWQSVFNANGVDQDNELRILKTGLTSTGYLSVQCTYSAPTIAPAQMFAGSGSNTTAGNQFPAIVPKSSGSNINASEAASQYSATSFRFDIAEDASNVSHDFILTALTISGRGVDPF